jgi:hypothetical protein
MSNKETDKKEEGINSENNPCYFTISYHFNKC